MNRTALEFVVDASLKTRVEERLRQSAGEALARLIVAPIDGTPRYRITALITDAMAAAVMKAVMNELDKSG
jgi:hypothetical protein